MPNTKITDLLLESFASKNLATALTQSQEFSPQPNSDGSYDLSFSITVDSENFEHKSSVGLIAAADCSFEVTLYGCLHDQSTGWLWMKAGGFTFRGGMYTPSIILYDSNGYAVDEKTAQTNRSIGLTAKKDSEIGNNIAHIIMRNTDDNLRYEFFVNMIAKCQRLAS